MRPIKTGILASTALMLVPFITSSAFAFLLAHGEITLLGLLLVFTAFAWLRTPQFLRQRFLLIAILLIAATRIAFSLLRSFVQYYAWSHSDFGQLFLPPYSSWNYFLGYVGLHFLLGTGLALLAGLVAYLFLRTLHRYRDRFFEGGEVELGCAVCLLVGWPGVVIFLAGTALGIVLVSIVRKVWFAQIYTTLGIPMLIGAVLAFLLQFWLIATLGLTVLKT